MSQTTRTRGPAPRTIESPRPRGPLSRVASRLGLRARRRRGAPSQPAAAPLSDAAAGVAAALQALLLSFAVVALLALTAYLAATGASTTGPDPQWGRPVGVAAAIWLLGHGVPLTADGVTITFVPLGLGALALFACYASAKRTARPTWASWGAGTAAYAVATTAAALLAGTAHGWAFLLAPVAGAVVGGAGLAAGVLVRPDAPRMAEVGERAERLAPAVLPAVLRLGLRGGLVATGLLTVGAALLVAAWAVAGRATSSDIVGALDPGLTGGIVLAVAQLAVVPDLVVWAVAWLAGPGFAIGTGTHFTTVDVVSGPLPALPVLAALPGPDWANALTLWAPAVVVACGVVAGVFAWRRLDPELVRWPDLGWVVLGIVGSSGVVVGVLQAVAGGSAGPGRLAVVGADPLLAGALVAAEVGLGAGAVLVGARLDLAARRRDLAGWLTDRRDRRAAPDEPVSGGADAGPVPVPSAAREPGPEPVPPS